MKDLLKKWINGSGTWSEEQKLRQAAEKDHFLAEAMDGYDAFPITDHAAKIEQLKGRFRKPSKSKKGLVISLSTGRSGSNYWCYRYFVLGAKRGRTTRYFESTNGAIRSISSITK